MTPDSLAITALAFAIQLAEETISVGGPVSAENIVEAAQKFLNFLKQNEAAE